MSFIDGEKNYKNLVMCKLLLQKTEIVLYQIVTGEK